MYISGTLLWLVIFSAFVIVHLTLARNPVPDDITASRRHMNRGEDRLAHTHRNRLRNRFSAMRSRGRRGGRGGRLSITSLENDLARAHTAEEISRVFHRHSILAPERKPWGRGSAASWDLFSGRWPGDGSGSNEIYGVGGAPAALMTTGDADNVGTRTSTVEALAIEHYQNMTSSNECGEPQPVVLDVGSSKYRSPTKYIFPRQFILYRCGVLGQCVEQQRKSCVPRTAETVDLPFIVAPVHGGGSSKFLRFINHTSCECKSNGYLSACQVTDIDQEEEDSGVVVNNEEYLTLHGAAGSSADCLCPPPYVSTRTHLGCSCDCLESNDECLNIKYGIETLPWKSHNLIVEGICVKPQCARGVYNMACRSCPMAEAKLR